MKIHTALIQMVKTLSVTTALKVAAPTSKNRRCAREEGLNASLHSGLYPTFKGIEGSVNRLDPTSNSAFEYLQQLWPCSLCELIALETNRYAMQKGRSKWNNTTTAEIWKFLGISIFRIACFARLHVLL